MQAFSELSVCVTTRQDDRQYLTRYGERVMVSTWYGVLVIDSAAPHLHLPVISQGD
mgnify:CR=1 FL=1